ncbi:MAG: hypothetical protein KAJ28_06765 [Flavobacteriaceae bacterium]|nr:hypothetical protein [Flavobacteriaceae bacterium]
MQEQFIKFLKAKTQDNTSFVEEIASVLDIGYDAAYRRVNNKTNLSLEESVILARHYKISLNKLFEVSNQNTIVAELSPRITNIVDLENYFIQSLINLAPLAKIKGATIIYSAKDIPLFHSLKDTFLTRFKMFVWMKDANVDISLSKVSFDDFNKSIPKTLLDSAFKLGEIYNYINIIEIWTDNTLSGSLQQVLYYFESGLLSKEDALHICDDIEKVIHHIEKQTIKQSLIGSKNKSTYHLYKCDLHPLNNTIMVKTAHQKVFFSPYSVINYFKIEHQQTCDHIYELLEKQMKNSKLLVNTGEKDRILFFNKILKKIDTVRVRIKIDEKLSYL